MREIKFRYIWKYKDREEFKVEYKTLDQIESEDSWQGSLPYSLISRDEFTGLKDKNGKEIYEGDIVRSERLNAVADIKYGNAHFFMVSHNGAAMGWELSPDADEIEIIGNIYENPELMSEAPKAAV